MIFSMIIDFHVHTFPESIAKKALDKLSKSADAIYYVNGTMDAMLTSMKKSGISKSVLLPVATGSHQTDTINRLAIEINQRSSQTGIYSFGGIHPDNTDYKSILRNLANQGIKGIKLHPVFQDTLIDDIRYLRILDCACENNLAITVHAGYDISFPGKEQATPEHLLPVIEKLQPKKLILAHMGGWNCWDEAENLLAGQDVYFDTSFCLTPIRRLNQKTEPQMTKEQFCRIVRKHGAKRILFGSDSPWSDQKEAAKLIKESGLTPEECSLILSENGKELLN